MPLGTPRFRRDRCNLHSPSCWSSWSSLAHRDADVAEFAGNASNPPNHLTREDDTTDSASRVVPHASRFIPAKREKSPSRVQILDEHGHWTLQGESANTEAFRPHLPERVGRALGFGTGRDIGGRRDVLAAVLHSDTRADPIGTITVAPVTCGINPLPNVRVIRRVARSTET
jgi:hypothetical protein